MAFKTTLYELDPATGDIRPEARKTLGDYLSRRTSKASTGEEKTSDASVPGTYTYNPPTINAFTISGNDGVISTTIIESNVNGQETFVEEQVDLERFGKSGDFDTDKFILNDLDSKHRHRLLKDVADGDGVTQSKNVLTQEVQKQVIANLSRNRFAAKREFTSDENSSKTTPMLGIGWNENSSKTVNDGKQSSIYDEMMKDAIRSLILITGETPLIPSTDTTSDAVLLPSFAQSSLTLVDTSLLHPTRVTDTDRLVINPEDAEKLEGQEDNTSSKYTRYSNGSLNSFLEPFGGVFPTSMIITALILLIVTLVAAAAVALVFGLLSRMQPRGKKEDKYPMGAERGVAFGSKLDNLDPGSLLDVICRFVGLTHTYTKYNGISFPEPLTYLQAALVGISTFVGVDVGTGAAGFAGQAASVILSLVGGPGYYVIMTRAVIRSIIALGEALIDIGQSNAVSDGIESVFAFLGKLRDSKIIRFVDTLARIGLVDQMKILTAPISAIMEPVSNSSNPTARVSRSRAYTNKRTLSTAHSEAANMTTQLLPKEFKFASIAYSHNSKKLVELPFFATTTETYVTAAQVKELEDKLEAEYVPFYFQDLRTNEILNFHAFIEDLSDSYSPSYTTVDGYGRMDPVSIYKGTTRSISLSFMVVATSPEDFDRMWYTINRFVMMVYPQWTTGEELTGGGTDSEYTFTQPFSQVIGASPMIRMRVGELIHSNYSRFNLARIFGLGGKSAEAKNNFVGKNDTATEESINNAIKTIEPPYFKMDTTGQTAITMFIKHVPNITLVRVEKGTDCKSYSGYPESIALFTTRTGLPETSTGTVISYEQDGVDNINVVVKLDTPFISSTSFKGKPTSFDVTHVVVSSNTIEVKSTAVPAPVPLDTTQLLDPLTNLFDNFGDSSSIISNGKSTNSIVRSFESAGGRGLAGFITSLGFEWYNDNTLWETEKQGSRAPMSCKVSIAFAPIHDIPMGLDVNGFPRAVPYPVGKTVRSTFFPELDDNDTNIVKPLLKKLREE